MKNSQFSSIAPVTSMSISFFILLMFVSMTALAQIASVKGAVSASTLPVRYAIMTFVDNGDTTKKTSVVTDTAGRYSISLVTSVRLGDAPPSDFELEQNYPNPFSSSTKIPYKLSSQADVKVTVYDILGREIRTFSLGDQAIGAHGVLWDGKDNLGNIVSRGVYFSQLQSKGKSQIRKMIFGFSGNDFSVLPPGLLSSKMSESRKAVSSGLQGATFSVRIENTDSTFPPIVAQQYANVAVQNGGTQDFSVSTNGTFPDPTAAVAYVDEPQQFIRGFGGANILQWRPDMTVDQVQKAFGAGPGQIGFSILRLRVPYDPSGTAFSMQISTAQLAQSLGAIVFASPWTPPPAMKSNNNIVAGTLNESSYTAYAAYLKSFADYMTANGAPLYAISLQNEPDANVTYESCSWSATQFLNFMKNNAPSIGTRVIMPESENFQHSLSDPTLNDSVAAANTSIVAGHIYGGGIATYPLAVSKGKEVWMTEHLDTDTSWNAVLLTGKEISDCMKVGWNAYVTWYTVRFYGPIDETGNVTKRGYVMSQFARFVRPGFTRVRSTDYALRSLVDVTAYRKGSKTILVAVNRATTAKSQIFVLWNGTVGTFTPYVTSTSKNCEQQSVVTFKNGSFSYTLDPLSVTTFVLN